MRIIDEVYPLIKCEARLSDDGTLWIKTDTKSAEQTKRVLIEYAENSFCKTFYQDREEPPTVSADRPHGEWIPCSDRLPSEERHYLCCNKGYLPFIADYYGGQWYDFEREISRVDAWIPLPKPYKGGDGE